jgi:hypothetical protein
VPQITTAVRPEIDTVPAPALGGRDLTVDLLRAIAMVLVAVGHWLVVVPRYEDGRFDGVNALETVPLMGQLTWIFQVMPLFFAVGGFAGAASWRAARHRDTSYPAWLRTRLVRLLRPSLVLFGLWTAVTAGGRMLGADAELMELLGFLVVVPVWFLAVYVVVTALVPAFLVAHERAGVAVLAALGIAAVVIDAIRIADGPEAVTYLNFFFVFLLAQQLGFFWADGRVAHPLRWLAGGLAALWLATHIGPYPVSMVGVPGEELANNAPPTVCLIALGVAQVGAAVAARPWLESMLRRTRVQAATLALNLHAMTILLWHFTALALAALVLLPLGVVPELADGTAAWWLVRVASVVVLAPVLAGLVAVVGRFERAQVASTPDPGAGGWATARLAGAVVLLAAGFAMVAVRGLHEVSTPYGLPLMAMALVGTGTALVAVRR